MKKIIAVAVASAFALPAVAAEISVGGSIEYVYISGDSAEDRVTDNDNLISVSATEELPHGITITGTMNVYNDTPASGTSTLGTDGTNIALSGEFGTFTVGDTTGAMDATGDYTDVAPSGGGYAGDGSDHALKYQLPTIVEGLQLIVSQHPEGTNTTGAGSNAAVDADNEGSAFSATYSFGGADIYYASEEAGDETRGGYGLRYSMAGLTLAYEVRDDEEVDGTAGDEVEHSGMALTYKMGDILLGMENQETTETGGDPLTDAEEVDVQVIFAEYNLGSNVDVFLATVDDKTATDADTTRVGVEYNF